MQQNDGVPDGRLDPRSEEGTICLYPNKRCDHPRVVKANGELHKFCQFHRDKANYNQRQLEFKRRLRQEQERSGRQDPRIPAGILPGHPRAGETDDDFELDEEDMRLIEQVAAANIDRGE